jgi:alpha-ketoglutarate-dependent taurine dioxygenase
MSAVQEYPSVVELDIAQQRAWWSVEGAAIQAVLAQRCGGDVAGHELLEPDDAAALRRQLCSVAPGLADLTDRVRRAFDQERACAVVIARMGLGGYDDDQRRKGMFAFAAMLGDPMANHPQDAVVWDVRDRGHDERVRVTHSTSSRAAGYHTDAGYLKSPPRFFLLYAMTAAACGGGESLIRDGRIVLRQLGETEQGRAAIEALSQPLPRRVAAKFHPVADFAEDGLQYSPIFADTPLWRWARKNNRIGLERNPNYATPQVWRALATVTEQLHNNPDEMHARVPTDGVIVVNNHIALHGRTAFTDPTRHLLRIRFHEPV